MVIFLDKKAQDGFTYYFMSALISDGDWLFNTLKDEIVKVDSPKLVDEFNEANVKFGQFLFVIHASDNPELKEFGITETLTDKVWYLRLEESEKKAIVDKFTKELSRTQITPFNERISYFRKRHDNIITDLMVKRTSEIKSAAVKFSNSDGFMAFTDEVKFTAFTAGAEWADINLNFERCLEIMNLGMTLRGHQLAGYSDKSGNEELIEWINKQKKQ